MDGNGNPRLYIVDFEHASFLPISFLSFVVLEDNPWATSLALKKRLEGFLSHDNVAVMKEICYMFQTCVWTIGLTEEQRAARKGGEQ